MKTRFILGSALAAVLLMWGGTGKVMAQKNIDKKAEDWSLVEASDSDRCKRDGWVGGEVSASEALNLSPSKRRP